MKKFLVVFMVFFTLLSCTENSIEQEADKINTQIENISTDTEKTEENSENLETNQDDTMSKKQLQNGDKVAIITTNKGKIQIFLETQKAPITTNNFIGLAKDGYYDGIIFHRIIKDFMIQGGDPDGTGMGGTSIYGEKFVDEIHPDLKNDTYTISMANAGPNTNGSQFFINVKSNNFLDGKHAVFGEVIEGADNVMKISKVKTKAGDAPVNEVKMIQVEVKEYKDGKLVDFDFDTEAVVKEYEKTIIEKQEAKKNKKIAVDDIVTIDFTIKKEDGTEVVTTQQQLQIVEEAELLRGLNEGLKGMKIGENKTLTLAPEEAYGEYKEELKKEVPKSDLQSFVDAGFKLEVGVKLPTQVGELEILEVTDDAVTIDMNIPLAGETIIIEFSVVDIKA